MEAYPSSNKQTNKQTFEKRKENKKSVKSQCETKKNEENKIGKNPKMS